LALLASGGRRVPQAIARATSGEGQSVISRLVGEVQKMPREVWPMVQAHWSRPESFRGLAAYLESLPAVSREAGARELPRAIPLFILSAKNSTPSQIAERDELARRSIEGRHVVADSGHWIHLDQPQLVVKAIQEMLDRCRKA
jgi:pimeloyl-ACP methyl ester carboxylesterase